MSGFDSPLNNIRIASPCSADWNEMYGNERKRFCGDCKLNVYNLSGMSRRDAEELLRGSEGRLCVRYYQRADGTILTDDCPVGWAKVKRRARVAATAAFSLIVTLFSGLLFVSLFSRNKSLVRKFPIPFVTPTPKYEPLMGAIAMPTPTPKATPKSTPKPTMTEVMGDVDVSEIRGKVDAAAGTAL
jgi:hypothetical protein